MPTRIVTYRYPRTTYVRQYVDHFFQMHADQISGSVLDLGSGGNNEQYFRELSSDIDEYLSVDLSASPSLDLIADARHLPFDENSFDTIILSEVLEHIPIQNVKSTLKEVKRVLKPSGRLMASTPFIQPIHGEPNDFYRATHYGLASVLNDIGMQYDITIGGGYSQVILHLLHRPLFILTQEIGTTTPSYIFAIFHYLIVGVAFIAGRGLSILAGEEILTRRYITQFVVASPE